MEAFNAEFSKLLSRWIKPSVSYNIEKQSDINLLTIEEVVKAIQDVLQNTFNVNLQTLLSDKLRTPANEFVPKIPDAPDIHKYVQEHKPILNNTPSLGTPITADFGDDLGSSKTCPSTIPFEVKMDVVDTEANSISTSDVKQSDRMNMTDVGRSKTFTAQRDRTFVEESGQIKLSQNELNTFMKCLDEYRLNACSMIKSIDTIKDKMKTPKPIRRLSAMNFPGILRTSTARTKTRKSMILGIPGTPTTSRVSPVISKPVSTTKSASAITLQSSRPVKRLLPSRSMNNSGLSERNKSTRLQAKSLDLPISKGSPGTLVSKPTMLLIKSTALGESSKLSFGTKSSGKVKPKPLKYPYSQSSIPKVSMKHKTTDKLQ